jgi:hypothetical protein
MKRLLILTVLGALLSGAAGCRFFDCLFRGPACQQAAAPAVTYTNPCPTYGNPCDPCAGAPSAPVMTPGPAETYAPAPAR